VRGLTPRPPVATQALDYAPIAYAKPVPARPPAKKSAGLAAVLGLLLPGVGLLYAAPVSAAVAATVVTFVSVKMLASLPLIGWLLKSVGLGICALASAILGIGYARAYNAHGRRTHTSLEGLRTAAHATGLPRSFKNALP
jgi:hypothetical protein